MKNGERYRVKPVFSMTKETNGLHPTIGKVVWVHPVGRFAVLEFAGGIRECFFPEQLTASNLMLQKKGRRK